MNNQILDFLDFLNGSHTSIQASHEIVKRLEESGFKALKEEEQWALQVGGKYYVCRDTSVVAFTLGSKNLLDTGYKIGAAHIDSPSLKIKPESLKTENGITRVSVEVYGGPIIGSWIDRSLSIAGKIAIKQEDNLRFLPVNLKQPVAVIPNAALHLNREINKGFEYNKQIHLQAILQSKESEKNPLMEALAKAAGVSVENISGSELFLYDFEPAEICGLDQSLIMSARLDNLGMTHSIMSAIREVDNSENTCVAALFDNEEIGSETRQGADSSFLENVLERIALNIGFSREEYLRILSKSFLISGDMAHSYHPSYPEKYDPSYAPVMNGGPVIKWNANYNYATNLESSQRFKRLCEIAEVPCQTYIIRSDLLCGSTVGHIISSRLGIPVVDVGNPLWAMHSVRETVGVEDHINMIKVLKVYYQ